MRRAVSVSLIFTAFLGAGGVAWSAALGELVLLGRAGNVRFGATEADVAGGAGPAAAWTPGADVHYGFTAGRLSSVQLTTSSATATRELLSQLGAAMGRTFTESDYTRPWDASADAVELHWDGSDTGGGTLTLTPKAGAPPSEAPLPVTVPDAAPPKPAPAAAPAKPAPAAPVKPPAAPAVKPAAEKPVAAPAKPAAEKPVAAPAKPAAEKPSAAPVPPVPAAPETSGSATASSIPAVAPASGGPASAAPAPPATSGSSAAVSQMASGPQGEAVKPAVASSTDPSVPAAASAPAVASASTDAPPEPTRAEKAGSVALTGLIDDGKFQELHFGSNLARIEGLRATQSTGELSYFVRPGDETGFDGVDIAEVAYVFRQDQLVAVALRAAGSDGSLRLAEAFDALLGKPVSASRAEGSATWKGDKVTVTMRLTPDGGDTVALVMSNPATPAKQP